MSDIRDGVPLVITIKYCVMTDNTELYLHPVHDEFSVDLWKRCKGMGRISKYLVMWVSKAIWIKK